MDASEIRLKDRSVLLVGPLSRWIQTLAQKLIQSSSNVIFMDQKVDMAQRFASGLNDSREINEKFGRAAAVACSFANDQAYKDSVSQAAQCFGGLDAVVDNLYTPSYTKFSDYSGTESFSQDLNSNLLRSLLLTKAALPFLTTRKRGRIVYIVPSVNLPIQQSPVALGVREGLSAFAKSLSMELSATQCGVNCADLGLTEEMALALSPGASTTVNKALARLKEQHPNIILSDSERLADGVLFLVCGLSQGLGGQTLNLK